MTAKNPSILKEPVVLVGNHEPLIFRRRCGYARVNEEQRFAYEHSEEMVKALAARGVTWVRTHFFKGFGLKAEAQEIEMTRQYVELCHRYGIKVELYTQFGTLQYETFLAEAPDLRDWVAVNEDGKFSSITYGHQDFRYRPCLTKDGYWNYFRSVLDAAIDHVKADGLGFDNVGAPTEPESCHCDACRQAFVDFLKTRYEIDTPAGQQMAKERFGFAILDHILPPNFNRWNTAVNYRTIVNPVFQEWINFRTDNLARRFEQIWNYVKGKKPDMLIEYNVYGDFGCNNAYLDGVDIHKLLPWMEAFWDERHPAAPEFTKEGLFLHRAHAYKLAQAYDAVVFGWHQGRDSEQRKLAISECLAFNRGHVSGFAYNADFARGSWPEADSFIRFRKAHPALFADSTSAAKVGLVECARSLAYNSVDTHYSEVLAFGSLLAGHVPFDLVCKPTTQSLARHAVIVLPNVECLSDAEAQVFIDYVAAGGGLVITDSTGQFDQWRRRRDGNAFAEMLSLAKSYDKLFGPAALPAGKPKTVEPSIKGTFGLGRFVYINRLSPVEKFRDTPDQWEIHTHYWHLPRNFQQFIDAVEFAGKGRMPVEITAPRGVAAELRQLEDGRLILHLLNYDLAGLSPAVLAKFRGVDAVQARLWTVGQDMPKVLKLHKSDGGVRVNIPSLPRYAILELTV